METTKIGLGERMRSRRRELGLQREQVAVAMGRCAEWVARVERETARPDSVEITKLSTMLGVTPDWLLLGSGAATDTA